MLSTPWQGQWRVNHKRDSDNRRRVQMGSRDGVGEKQTCPAPPPRPGDDAAPSTWGSSNLPTGPCGKP